MPRGWVEPTSGKRIKIGVHIKNVYPQFVNATVDNTTKESKATGFCIDVFDAVLRRLDCALPYEVAAYHIRDNEPDDFLYQIYHKVLSLLRLFSIVFSFLFIIFYIYCRTVILLKFLYLKGQS